MVTNWRAFAGRAFSRHDLESLIAFFRTGDEHKKAPKSFRDYVDSLGAAPLPRPLTDFPQLGSDFFSARSEKPGLSTSSPPPMLAIVPVRVDFEDSRMRTVPKLEASVDFCAGFEAHRRPHQFSDDFVTFDLYQKLQQGAAARDPCESPQEEKKNSSQQVTNSVGRHDEHDLKLPVVSKNNASATTTSSFSELDHVFGTSTSPTTQGEGISSLQLGHASGGGQGEELPPSLDPDRLPPLPAFVGLASMMAPPLLTLPVYALTQGDTVWEASKEVCHWADAAWAFLLLFDKQNPGGEAPRPRDAVVEQVALSVFEILCLRYGGGWPRLTLARGKGEAGVEDSQDSAWWDHVPGRSETWSEMVALSFCQAFLTPERSVRVAYRANGLMWRRVRDWALDSTSPVDLERNGYDCYYSGSIRTSERYRCLLLSSRSNADIACLYFPWILPWNLLEKDAGGAVAANDSGRSCDPQAGRGVGAEYQGNEVAAVSVVSDISISSPRQLIRFCSRLYDALVRNPGGRGMAQSTLPRVERELRKNLLQLLRDDRILHFEAHPLLQTLRISTPDFSKMPLHTRQSVARACLSRRLRGVPLLDAFVQPMKWSPAISDVGARFVSSSNSKAVLPAVEGTGDGGQIVASGSIVVDGVEDLGDKAQFQEKPTSAENASGPEGPFKFQLKYHKNSTAWGIQMQRHSAVASWLGKHARVQHIVSGDIKGTMRKGMGRSTGHVSEKSRDRAKWRAAKSSSIIAHDPLKDGTSNRVEALDALYLNSLRVLCCETSSSWLRFLLDLAPKTSAQQQINSNTMIESTQEQQQRGRVQLDVSAAKRIILLAASDIALTGSLISDLSSRIDAMPEPLADELLDFIWVKV
ncbi:unnamed protein product [Amoebophrya sp. A25]|nr:unnamed protein product [Amoebophrya sp. A25]|eukprot:GSA25T00014618001.1